MIMRSISRADIIYVAFPRLQRALIVDLRQGEPASPALFVTTLDFISERQTATLRRLFPDSSTPDAYANVVWGGSVRAFAEQGVLPAILNRLPAEGTRDAMVVFEELRDAERAPAARETRARVPIESARADGEP